MVLIKSAASCAVADAENITGNPSFLAILFINVLNCCSFVVVNSCSASDSIPVSSARNSSDFSKSFRYTTYSSVSFSFMADLPLAILFLFSFSISSLNFSFAVSY